jgi:hypothetical protein
LLYRIDPATNTVSATVPFSEFAEDAVISATGAAVYLGVELPREAAGIPFGLLRIDPATNQVVAPVGRALGQLEALGRTENTLWALLFGDGLVRFDPTTLAEIGRIDVDGYGLAAAPPGVWTLRADGLVAFDTTSTSPAVTVPIIGGDFGALAASEGAVWVWDPRVGALTQIAAG